MLFQLQVFNTRADFDEFLRLCPHTVVRSFVPFSGRYLGQISVHPREYDTFEEWKKAHPPIPPKQASTKFEIPFMTEEQVKEHLNTQKKAKAKPDKGEWIIERDGQRGFLRCDHCGKRLQYPYPTDFCPLCGNEKTNAANLRELLNTRKE